MKTWIVTAILALAPAAALGCGHGQSQSGGAKTAAQSQGASPSQTEGQTEAQPQTTAQQQGTHEHEHATGKTAGVAMPKDAKLVASATGAELRAFPELKRHKGMAQAQPRHHGQTQPQRVEEVTNVRATDNVYTTQQSYHDTVQFFDKEAKSQGTKQLERTVTQTATGWTFQLANGAVEDVIVRNTSPTTIETLRAHGSEAEITPQK